MPRNRFLVDLALAWLGPLYCKDRLCRSPIFLARYYGLAGKEAKVIGPGHTHSNNLARQLLIRGVIRKSDVFWMARPGQQHRG